MLHEDFNIRKIYAKMGTKDLANEKKKQKQKSIGEDLLSWLRSDGKDWIIRVITGDGTWYDPKAHRQSQLWVEKGGDRPKKARISKSRLKAMLMVFFRQYPRYR